MKSKAYDDWLGLYNDDLIEIWHQERDELKKTSMVLFVLRRELSRIQKEVELDVAKAQNSLQQRDELNSTFMSATTAVRKSRGKENVENCWTSACLGIKPLDDVGDDVESPEIFRIASPKSEKSHIDDRLKENETSPTIKKRMKRPKNKFKQNLSPSLLLRRNTTENSHTPSANNQHENMDFKTPENKATIQKDESDLDQVLIDSTIIDSTPYAPSTKKSKSFGLGKSHAKSSSRSLNKSFKRAKCSSNDTTYLPNHTNTLTQMMSRGVSKIKRKEPNILGTSDDDLPSSMDINDILAYVDEHSMNPSTPGKSTTNSEHPIWNRGEYGKPLKDKLSQVSDSFICDYDVVDIRSKVPKQSLKGGVREYQKDCLSGWSCEDCKSFYENLDVSPGDLEKKMEECFKHHRKLKPHQQTYAGFWDVGMPQTPDSQLTKDQSTVFHPYE